MIILNNNQPPAELSRIYGEEDYYWYLHSPEFREAFLKPLAERVNALGGACLDVACGAGWLADYITVPYAGFDGSAVAIAKAKVAHPNKVFYEARFEDPQGLAGTFETVIFGGVLDVLVRKDCYIELLELYRERYTAKWLVVYDLVRLDTTEIDKKYRLRSEFTNTAHVAGLQEVKKHRKVRVYACE